MSKYKWKANQMTPGRKVLRTGELQTLMMKRCKEMDDAIKEGIVTMEELRTFAWEHNLNFKRDYVEKVLNYELFPPKEISEYIRRQRELDGRFDTVDAAHHLKEHRHKSALETKRLERRARAMRAQEIINNTESFLVNHPEYQVHQEEK